MGLSNETLAKARGRRDKLAAGCALKLEAAAGAITKYLRACNECYDDTKAVDVCDPRLQLRDEIIAFIELLKIDTNLEHQEKS